MSLYTLENIWDSLDINALSRICDCFDQYEYATSKILANYICNHEKAVLLFFVVVSTIYLSNMFIYISSVEVQNELTISSFRTHVF
jgi:hypothetical protein